MRSKVTIREVAQLAGVSLGTASRALTGSGPVSKDAREKVHAAAKALDYQPNGSARALRQSKTNAVGLLVSDIRNPFFAELAHTVQISLAQSGYVTLLGNAAEDAESQEGFLKQLATQQVDGVIVAPRLDATSEVAAMIEKGTPVVFVDRFIEGIAAPSVTCDPTNGIVEAVKQLSAAQCERVAFVAGPQETSTGRERLEAFTRIMQKNYPDLEQNLCVVGTYSTEETRAQLESLLDRQVDAVILGYAPHALELLDLLAQRGMRVGIDISVVTFDNTTLFSHLTPPLAVVDQNITGMALEAVKLLLNLISGEQVSSVRLESSFIPRASIVGFEKTGNVTQVRRCKRDYN